MPSRIGVLQTGCDSRTRGFAYAGTIDLWLRAASTVHSRATFGSGVSNEATYAERLPGELGKRFPDACSRRSSPAFRRTPRSKVFAISRTAVSLSSPTRGSSTSRSTTICPRWVFHAQRLEILHGVAELASERGIDSLLLQPAYQASVSHLCVLTRFARDLGVVMSGPGVSLHAPGVPSRGGNSHAHRSVTAALAEIRGIRVGLLRLIGLVGELL